MSISDTNSPAITFEAPTGPGTVVSPTNVNTESAMPMTDDQKLANQTVTSLSVTNQQGIVFDEQTEQEIVRVPDTIRTIAACEPQWDNKKFFAVPVRIKSGTWTTTLTQGSVLTSVPIPSFIYPFDRWYDVMSRYMYFRCRVRFRFELNGTSFHAGKVHVAVVPAGKVDNIQVSPRLTSAVPSVSAYPANNSVVEIDAPWIAPCEFYTVQPPINGGLNQTLRYDYATLVVTVFNQLTAGTGASTSLNWTLYASLHDMELVIPRAVTGIAQGLIDVTNINNTIGSMENSTMPLNITGDAYDVKAGLPGLDLPADQESPHLIQRVATSTNHHVRGTPSIQRLSPYPSSQNVCSRYNFETSYDEMTIDFLKTRNSFIQTTSLSTSDPFGKVIYSCGISPVFDLLSAGVDAITAPMELLTKFFASWRGDLTYCVEVIATQFHTAKLFCGIQYGVDSVSDFTVGGRDPTTVYGQVIEVNKAKGCFEINVPFQYPLPWAPLRDYSYTWDDGTNILNPSKPANQFPFVQPCSSIGTFFIAVLNPLVIPSNVASTIALNVFVKGQKNLEFHTLASGSYLARPSAQVGVRDCKIESNTISNLNERMYSLRDILKRMKFAGEFKIAPMIAGSGIGFTGAIKYVNLKKLFTQGSFQNVMANYRSMAGDMRIKVVASFNGMSSVFVDNVHIIYLPPVFGMPSQTFDKVYCTNAAAAYIALTSTGSTESEFVPRINPLASIYATQQPILGFPTGASTVQVRPMQQSAIASEVLTATAPVREFEIPYYSNSKYVHVPFITNEWAQNGFDENPYGYLVFVQFVNNLSAVTATTLGASISLYAAGGDTIRCAHYVPAFEDADSDVSVPRTGGGKNFVPGTPSVLP